MSTNYAAAELLVYDPVGSNRNSTRANLHSLGFRVVHPAASLDVMEQRLKARTPDLILCEVAGAEVELCALIQTLRQGRIGENPFAIVVVTTWRRDGDLVGHVLNSGADDLLARPFSMQQLGERIRSHVERRKKFVVTSDYIGPDRRRDPGRASAECFEVPNTLKIRAEDRSGDTERVVAIEVKRGKDQINKEKLRRDSFQLCVQWRKFEQRRPDAPDYASILDRIEELASDIERRATEFGVSNGKKPCDEISDAARTIRDCFPKMTPDNMPSEFGVALHLLGHSALTLGQIFAPGEVEPAQLVELDAIVARADIRQAAAKGAFGPSVSLAAGGRVGALQA